MNYSTAAQKKMVWLTLMSLKWGYWKNIMRISHATLFGWCSACFSLLNEEQIEIMIFSAFPLQFEWHQMMDDQPNNLCLSGTLNCFKSGILTSIHHQVQIELFIEGNFMMFSTVFRQIYSSINSVMTHWHLKGAEPQ